MRITILDGHPQPETGWVEYLAALTAALQAGGAEVAHLPLRSLELRPCTGCFGCWVKTPGACSVPDDSVQTCKAQISADLVIWASPMIMGFPSALLKQVLDKSIPLVHPYFTVVDGEFHHRARYERYPRIALLLAPEAGVAPPVAEEGLRLAEMILARTALNLKGGLTYAARTTQPPAAVAHALLQGPPPMTAPALPKATVGVQVAPPGGLLLLNGSPRGGKGNTPILLQQVAEGFARVPGSDGAPRPTRTRTLMRLNEMAAHVEAVTQAGRNGHAVLIGFPLYTDAMPGSVKHFFEALAPLAGAPDLPPLAFLIQCGFPETGHLRYVEQYLQHLTARLGAPYLGTMAR
ncbi:MAG: NAD(P)H-dependent oxidoreductase, partial [Caldilineaceae bacterium]